MNYEIKTLTSKDIFPMFRIISKIGINEFRSAFDPEEVRKMMAAAKGEKVDVAAIGTMIMFNIVSIMVSKLPECENEIYTFLEGITDLNRKQLEKMSMVDFTELIVAVIKKEEFSDFIGVVSKAFKSEK